MSTLQQLIQLEKWPEIISFLKTPNASVQVYTPSMRDKNLPLHHACERLAPDNVILELLRLYEDATWTKGKDGNLPLHIAVCNNLSVDVIEAFIRTFPHSLDQVNDAGYTPRDFNHDDLFACQTLNRPTMCWIQLIDDEEREDDYECRLNTLQSQIDVSLEQLSASSTNFDDMIARLQIVEEKISEFQLDDPPVNCDERVEALRARADETIKKMDVRMSRLEDDARAEMAKEYMAKAALRAGQGALMKRLTRTAAEAEILCRDVEEVKVRVQVEKALNESARKMVGGMQKGGALEL
mmetsp:Transcript_5876/g.7409  ORF Transcript_5876/g.7409 Transcript_5876/m.7409 type:complete len:296 (-) Transcript_5876:24-911(-)|eukprot:CAMPEP_0172498006 /NCGR_PEP_ID=MMETSP1066-20121228/107996_1 /TAXON_ID=671091 /ORGANISM="Coscinodiscus wailesii, Strain CCMP2513" /LENGTH=295 /DNA_ID=CAMNT_0013271083 /DNA_START=84 /DNA_END=971 /DNA_ORIENTATION=+